jgi:cytochrome P450
LDDQDLWMVSRYADCRALLTDERFQRSPGGQGPAFLDQLPEAAREPMKLLTTYSMIMMDDPAHRRLRGLVVKPFTPRAIARIGERVAELAQALLDRLEHDGPVDLRESFALPIPSTVINEMTGVPDADRDSFQKGTQALIAGSADYGQDNWIRKINEMTELVRALIEHKRYEPGEDILTGLIHAEEEGDRLDEHELMAMVFLLITAGYETTYNLITNAVVTLLDNPDQLERLCSAPDDEELWRGAIDEILRYNSPVGGTEPVTATTDVVWHDTTIPAGASVVPLTQSANRDPEVFEDPDRFDIDRRPNNHLSFGHGVHFCLGANLARLESRVALGILFQRNPNLRLAVDRSELKLEPLPLWTRYQTLPVRFG